MPKPTKKPAEVHLSQLQLAVMRTLWATGEASTAQVAAALAPRRGLAHTTVATLLTRLEKRGVVALRREGRQLVYRALITEPEVKRSMVAEMIATLFRGDAGALASHLVHDSEITPGDMKRIRAMLAQDRKEKGRG